MRRDVRIGPRALLLSAAIAAGCATGGIDLQGVDDAGADRIEDAGEAEADAGDEGTEDAGVDGPDAMDGDAAEDVPDAACDPGLTPCGAVCVDTRTDRRHCGGCGVACEEAENAVAVCELSTCLLACLPGWQDRDGLPGCEYACGSTSDPEACNGIDDDCDGETDEGFPCAVGRAVGCTTSCGTAGSGFCTPACVVPSGAACVPPAETCNGRDDDCDTTPDDGFACARGASGSCTTTCGTTGSRTCGDACAWGACTPPVETCNGADDDCDTEPDDGFACARGASGTCATACGTTGSRRCGDACAWGACVPPAEACNAGDDDCDGLTDEDFACSPGAAGNCSTSCGSIGTHACRGDCTWTPCAPPEEFCNAGDDDCDGETDEGFRVVARATTYTALSGYVASCNGTTQRAGLDCNAAFHRSCWIPGCHTAGFGPLENAGDHAEVACVIGPPVVAVTYAALSAIQGPCDGVTERIGPNCSAAINRYCQSLGHVSGFGPVENDGGTAYAACVSAGTAHSVATSYTVLAGHHDACNGSYERWGMSCNAAIHRFCGSLGYVTGFGPVENLLDAAWVVCLSS
jgi:hypothetical protein